MADPKIKRAHEVLNYLSEDEEVIRLAELRKKKIMDEISRLEGAKEEGEKEGIKIGENKKAIEIAKGLLDVLDIPTIAEKTGLSEEKIRELKEMK